MPLRTLETLAFEKLLRIHSTEEFHRNRYTSFTAVPETCEVVMDKPYSKDGNHNSKQPHSMIDGHYGMEVEMSDEAVSTKETESSSENATEADSATSISQASSGSPAGLQAIVSRKS